MDKPQQRTIVITGGSGGIGLHSAIGVAKTGAHIIVIGRDARRGDEAVQTIKRSSNNADIHFVQGDLSSLSGVESLASSLQRHTEKIDVLVNNAGYLGDSLAMSEDGVELHFAVNVLAPWRLTHLLLPTLMSAPDPHVINVSGGDRPAAIDPHNLQAEAGFRGLMTYTHSKSVLEAMSVLLAHELESKGVRVNIVFPGRASTAMTRSLTVNALPGPMKLMYPFFRWFFRDDGGESAAKAARSTIWAASSIELEGVTGSYFDARCALQKLHSSAYKPEVHAAIRAVLEGSIGS